MLKRSLALVMVAGLGLFLAACEVQNDTDSTEGDVMVGDGAGTDTAPVDECPGTTAWACDEACAEGGIFDADCYTTVAKCGDANSTALLTDWFNGTYGPVMSENTRNCNWTDGVCDSQFRCSNKRCFCDPDCYNDAVDPMEAMPACAEDGHCDTWCPTGEDLDCAGNADDGKYCGN
jgi:hypothetical protein